MATINEAYEALFSKAQESIAARDKGVKVTIHVGSATCENAAGSRLVAKEFEKHIKASSRADIALRDVGCTGQCSLEPIVVVQRENAAPEFFSSVQVDGVHDIFLNHVMTDTSPAATATLPELNAGQKILKEHAQTECCFGYYGSVPFCAAQTRIALRNAGMIDPESIDEYLLRCGFKAITKALEKNDPEWVINEVLTSKLRGRGGAGFPTGKKWSFARMNEEKTRYVVCNADEGDPGAFMDRGMLESDPFSVIEGMMIAGFAIGAQKGFFYIRAEYPLAVERIQKAIEICRSKGLLGNNILGSEFSFDLEIRLGAGAFVCGEETALIHSIEGERGQPRVRPPFPAVKGLWGKPTIINNVETLANLAVVINLGGETFSKIGTEKSGGTKVFALAGKVNNTGLVEVPMGMTLREIVNTIGGGVPNGKKLKAVQTGGPAGGFIPASKLDTPVDYEHLAEVGSIMGSGGMIVLDEDDCMVDMAKFFMTFSQGESCGKCVPCREGTKRMLEILTKITEGKGTEADIDNLERLAVLSQKASLCGLGRAAPNPVLSSVRDFRDEYLAHVKDKTCPSKKCTALVRYEINSGKCVGCTACARNCPVGCISGDRKQPHVIDQDQCVKCGRCLEVCRFGAVDKQ